MNSPGRQVPNMLLEISGEVTPKKNGETEPKLKKCPVVDMTSDGRKVQCYKDNIAQKPGMFGP